MKKIWAISFASLLILNVFASEERFNTYQWNIKNIYLQNNKIDTTPYFEWWYYKVVIPETGKSFYFTYGVVNPFDFERFFNRAITLPMWMLQEISPQIKGFREVLLTTPLGKNTRGIFPLKKNGLLTL